MKDEQQKRSKSKIADEEGDLAAWIESQETLQQLLPHENALHRIQQDDIPALEKELKELEAKLPDLSEAAEKVPSVPFPESQSRY